MTGSIEQRPWTCEHGHRHTITIHIEDKTERVIGISSPAPCPCCDLYAAKLAHLQGDVRGERQR